MRRNACLVLWIVSLSLAIWLTGCGGAIPDRSGDPAQTSKTHAADAAEHDHAHEAEQEGPHGGHLVELAHHRNHVEWLHDDKTGKVILYVLDKNVHDAPGLAVADVVITTAITGGATTDYGFHPVETGDGTPATPCFWCQDKSLLTALKIGKGVTSTLRLKIDQQPFAVQIEHHEHAGHHHH